MPFLNYHHLRYFRAIAVEGSLTRAAETLRLSPSALSIQLKQLEESLGQELFRRENKRLELTEAGRVALDYAETIFRSGDELMDTLKNRSPSRRQILRIGTVATLSRNFVLETVHPLLDRENVELVLRSGTLRELLAQMEAHAIDVVLTNMPIRRDAETPWYSHLLAEQEVSLVAKKRRRGFRFPDSLDGAPLVLPSLENNVRADFDLLLDRHGVRPVIVAEVDDMAMLRLLARETDGFALVPPVVVRDELSTRRLVEQHRIREIRERFYAITPERKFPNSLVRELVSKGSTDFTER